MKGRPAQPPPWESAIDGDHPAFAPLDKAAMEKLALAAIAEAQLFIGGPANKLATDEQRFLADAERRRLHHEANVRVSSGAAQEEHVRRWVDALIDLGRFEEARFYDFEGKAELIAAACARSDDEDCGCEREKVTLAADGSLAKEDQSGHEIELDRHIALKFQFDPYRGQVGKLYECRHCKTLNVMLEPPPRQAEREMQQRIIEEHTRAALARGQRPSMQASDAVFLKTG